MTTIAMLYALVGLYVLLIVGRIFAPRGVRNWVYQTVIALDRLVNAIHGGYSTETISARCGRNNRWPYKLYRPIIDAIFYPFQGPNHCRRAFEKELSGFYDPPEYRAARPGP